MHGNTTATQPKKYLNRRRGTACSKCRAQPLARRPRRRKHQDLSGRGATCRVEHGLVSAAGPEATARRTSTHAALRAHMEAHRDGLALRCGRVMRKLGEVTEAEDLFEAPAHKGVARCGEAEHAHVGEMRAEFAEAEVIRAKRVALCVFQAMHSLEFTTVHEILGKTRDEDLLCHQVRLVDDNVGKRPRCVPVLYFLREAGKAQPLGRAKEEHRARRSGQGLFEGELFCGAVCAA